MSLQFRIESLESAASITPESSASVASLPARLSSPPKPSIRAHATGTTMDAAGALCSDGVFWSWADPVATTSAVPAQPGVCGALYWSWAGR